MPELYDRRELLAFRVDMRPIGKQRPIVTRNHGAFTPPKTVQAERRIAWTARAAMRGKQPTSLPVGVTITACFALPKTASKKDRETLPGTFRDKKPDLDNIEKLVNDALNGVVWLDDKQVVSQTSRKIYGTDDYLAVIVEEYRYN